MKKVGFFGGCFNPPTNIHINIAKELINNKILDKVIFVPVGDYYNKPSLVSAKDRYNMLELATTDYKDIEVEDLACNSKNKLFAIDSFKLIHEKYSKKYDVYYIMGSDNYEKMPLWKGYDELILNYKFVIIERSNYISTQETNNIIFYRNALENQLSSTIIREMIKNKEDVSDFIDTKVIKYIDKHKLYINQDIL